MAAGGRPMGDERYRVVKSDLVVTNPSGSAYKQEVFLAYDMQCKSVSVLVLSGPLKGYSIDTVVGEIIRARDHGTPMHNMPMVTPIVR